MRSIACRHCPKFSAATVTCTVPFGSPLRKCVTAAQEAHLHSLAGKDLLEIGFGKHSIPRRLVTSAGGTWTGIDPLGQPDTVARIGGACRGHVGAIPFADASFDIVVGIQTLEHWSDPLPDDSEAPGYARGLAEVHRVLKPGGTIYFDAPIHLHGHEMFISGDVDTIAAQFGHSLWSDVILEAWRRDHSPLPRYPTPDADLATWPVKFARSAPERIAAIRESGSVWLLVVTATKH
jgi:SAM-dependent methyltransferase